MKQRSYVLARTHEAGKLRALPAQPGAPITCCGLLLALTALGVYQM